MRSVTCLLLAALCVLALSAGSLPAADMKQGTADLKSAGPLAFGPNGLMFIGDPQSAAIFAIDTGDKASQANGPVKIAKIDERMAGLLGTTSGDLTIADMAVNPTSGTVYFSVGRGRGPQAPPVILRLDRKGDLTEFSLKDVKFSKAELPNPAEGRGRAQTITGMAYLNGKVYVAGLSNEEFSSKLRVIPFPFQQADRGTSIEIFHGNHGRVETNSPVRTFTTYEIAGEAQLLAAYTCTPLVRIPTSQLKPGEKIKGTTIAELGNRSTPLDMVIYNKGGKDYLLMSNTARGVMKIDLSKVATQDGINAKVSAETAGLAFETMKDLKGVVQLSQLDKTHALILVKEGNTHNLETIDLP
ncbi:MAG TPA: hypothetical protein VL371_24200 [Gemmataceae bacterium]|jgi:hypothetical protein|nr:hypothetical protein [Gemmataceae bacterium]